MASFCLIPQKVIEFKKALKNGELDPLKLSQMESVKRREFLEKYVGKDDAVQVNALFESKLLLKNQKAGMIAWAKKVAGITPQARRDLLAKIEKLEKVLNPKEEKMFLQDLANTRLGFDVSATEAKNIFDLSTTLQDARARAKDDGTFSNKSDKDAYGWAQVQLEKYVNDLKLRGQSISFREQPIKKVLDMVGQIPGVIKSAVASLDNSFFGRQGIKTLLDVRTSPIWAKNFLKSFKDIGKQLVAKGEWYKSGDDAALDAIKADIYSRPNAINGKYKAGKYGLDVFSEEAYPSSLPEKIPLLGRLFKASEAAYNGGALRMRADLADRLIRIAEKQGINTLDPRQAEGMGNLISSLTGRGSLGKGEVFAKEANALFFSIKFLRSNFDTLTAHQFDSKATPFVKKEAAKNLLSIVASTAAVLGLAKLIDPNSVDEDPRSTNFGKIKIFGQWTDITGGMGGLVTLASRITPTMHNGKWSFWNKSKSGIYTDLLAGGYGSRTALDIVEDFFEGKLSPMAGILRDVWKGETYSGEKPTIENELAKSTTPLSAQKFQELMKDPNASNILGTMILETIGFSGSSSAAQGKKWSQNPTKAQQAFLDKVGNKKFNEANDLYNQKYNEWFGWVQNEDSFKKLSDEDKQAVMTRKKTTLQDNVFKRYNFEYKTQKRSKKELDKIKELAQ